MKASDYNASIEPDKGLSVRNPTPPKPFTPFPVQLLPEPLRALAIEGSKSMRCDPALIILPMLATVGAAIGNARRLLVKDDWIVSPCLWTMVIAESGTVKTPALRLAKKPLEEIEFNANQRFDKADEKYEKDQAVFESAKREYDRSKSKVGERPKPPVPPIPERYIVKDVTLAALVEVLRDNPRGLLVPVDELGSWFGSFNKHDKGGGDAQAWLSIYSGESISVDRKGVRNANNAIRPLKVYDPFVAITGSIQPGLWPRTLGAEHQASGMAARFLMAWPPRQAKIWTDDGVSKSTQSAYVNLIGKLIGLETEFTESGRYKPKYIGMNFRAKKVWQSFFNSHNLEHLDRFGSLAAASAKLEEIPARIAMILHNVRLATGEIEKDQIDPETMIIAVAIGQWFMAEAERIYGIMAGEAVNKHYGELLEWIRLKGGSLTARELARGNRRYQDSDEAEDDLNRLVEMGWGRWDPVPPGSAGGRPTRRFTIASVDETPSVAGKTAGYVNTCELNESETTDFEEIQCVESVPDFDMTEDPGNEIEVMF